MILMIGSILGFIAVAFGALAEHGLRENVTEEHFRYLMTALRYNQVHAVLICAIGLFLIHVGDSRSIRLFKWTGVLFILGTVLFSFSIYLSVTFNLPRLLILTPVGGMTLIVAWVMLFFSAFKTRKK